MTGNDSGALGPHHPFPGLRPYDFADAGWFCGRDDQTAALYCLVERSSFAAVVGSSGGGKSSLVRAGLLPELHRETEEPGGRSWSWFEMRPGDGPIDRLADALAGPEPAASDATARAVRAGRRDWLEVALRRSSFGLCDALGELDLPEGHIPLILIDQFEEIFRFADLGRGDRRDAGSREARHEAAAFVDLLLQASRAPGRRAHVLLTMRSDYLGECSRFQGLPQAVTSGQFLVPALTRTQREEVIRGPIHRAGGTIAADLVERLLNDSTDELDQLPVLQHALMRTWEQAGRRQGGRHLMLADYNAIGGLADALAVHADEVMADLPGLGIAVEQTFRALAELDRQNRPARRALRFARLHAETGCAEADLRAVIDRFRRSDCSFLVPPPSQKIEDETVVDIGHEALIRRWKRISAAREAGLAGMVPNGHHQAGWLWAEVSDGNSYRTMLELIDGAPAGVAPTLPMDQVKARLERWGSRPRTAAWAERYGGRFAAVQQLLERSSVMLTRTRQKSFLTRVALSVLLCLSLFSAAYASFLWRSAEEQRSIAVAQTAAANSAREKAEEQVREVRASLYWRRLNLWRDVLDPSDLRTLWELAGEGEEVRVAFVRQLAADPTLLRQLGVNPEPILRAVGLVWPPQAAGIVVSHAQGMANHPLDPERSEAWEIMASTRAVLALAERLDPATAAAVRRNAEATLLRASRRPTLDYEWLWVLAPTVAAARGQLKPPALAEILARLNREIDRAMKAPAREPFPSGNAIGVTIGAVAPDFDAARAKTAFDYLVAVAAVPTGSTTVRLRAVRPLGLLIERLPPAALGTALEKLLAALAAVTGADTDSSYPLVLVDAVERLAGRFTPADVAAADQNLARVLASYDDAVKAGVLARAAAAVMANHPAAAFPLVAEATIGPRAGDARAHVAEWLTLRGGGSSPAGPSSMLVARLRPASPGEPGYRAAAFARLLVTMAPHLDRAAAADLADAADAAVQLWTRPEDALVREALGRLLNAVAPALPGDRQERLLEIARSALAAAGGLEEAVAWARLLADRFPAAAESDDVQRFVEVLKYPTAAGEPTSVLLAALEERLPVERRSDETSLADMPLPRAAYWLRKQYGEAGRWMQPPLRPTPSGAM